MMTVVPVARIAPTVGNMPLRTFHSRAHSAGSVENATGSSVGIPASAACTDAICAASAAASGARVSTSSAAPSAPTRRIPAGSPGLSSTERSAARSANSTASTASLARRVTARHAVARSSNRISAVALCGCSGTVRYVISLMKPSVPSDPIIRCARMSTGSVKSTSAFRLYPVVFFIRNLWRMRAASAASSRVARASASSASTNARCDAMKAARLPASRVSTIVPSASTTRMPASVW